MLMRNTWAFLVTCCSSSVCIWLFYMSNLKGITFFSNKGPAKSEKLKCSANIYCGIILIRGGQCSWIVIILLVRGDVISWATGLLHKDARQSITLWRRDMNSLVRVNQEIREHQLTTNNDDSTVDLKERKAF